MNTKHCPGCNTTLPVTDFHKDKKTPSGLRCWCKVCVRKRFLEFKGKDNYVVRLQKYATARKTQRANTPATVWAFDSYHNAKARAQKQGIQFDLTKEWLLENLNDVCPLLGVPFTYGMGKTTPATPTIDRKDPKKGYTQDNCWVISAKANRIKTDASVEEITRVLIGLKQAGIV